MDQIKKKTNQILGSFNQSYSSKKPIKFLLSISLLCILFSYSSLLSTFYTNLFNYYYSSDRNYVFLLCNGILILIITNSGLSHANSNHFTNKRNIDPHQYTGYRDHIKNVNKNSQPNGYSASAVEVDKTERMVITYTYEVVENVGLVAHNNGEKEGKNEVDELHEFVGNEEKQVNEVCNVVVEEEFGNADQVEEEGGIELLSTEELNKKFDDFIRKMKDGIKFEAQRYHHNLVMV